MANTTIFPIHRLNRKVTAKLEKIVSANIPGNINKGLRNELNLIDEGHNMTETARVDKDGLTGETYVTLSAAFMQYVWLLTDIALKSIDLGIIQKEFTRFGVNTRLYPMIVDAILTMPKEEIIELSNLPVDFDIDKFRDYLKRSKPLFDVKEHERKIKLNISLLARLTNEGEMFSEQDFAGIEMDGEYEVAVSGAYCYAITFAMLHELSHFELGHLEMVEEALIESEKEKKEYERNADLNAFWSVFSDLDGREQYTGVIGVFCLLFALLMLNPTIEEDHEHPREDQRIFEIYDQVKNDNPKYTVLLVRMFNMWAQFAGEAGFPQVNGDNEESLKRIREFLNTKKVRA